MTDEYVPGREDIERAREAQPPRTPRRIAVFDLPSLFWTVAKAREGREKRPEGAALAALRHARDLTEQLGCDRAVFASERRPYWRASASVQGVKCIATRVDGGHNSVALTPPLIPYKEGRAVKSAELKVELALLEVALQTGGFAVLVVEEGRPFDPDEPEGGQGSAGPRPCFFEADDVCASLSVKLTEEGFDAVVVSNDWDLAGVLADDGSPAQVAKYRVHLARVSAVNNRYVTPEDVRREFGVPPSRLWEYLALAGDGDFKPYPGPEKVRGESRAGRARSPGIGEVGAKDVLSTFGSFDAAVAVAMRSDAADRAKFSKPIDRALALIRAGGEERAECARQLAKLRFDAPVSAEDAARGEQSWERAEAAVKEHRPAKPVAGQQTPDAAEEVRLGAEAKRTFMRTLREEEPVRASDEVCAAVAADPALSVKVHGMGLGSQLLPRSAFGEFSEPAPSACSSPSKTDPLGVFEMTQEDRASRHVQHRDALVSEGVPPAEADEMTGLAPPSDLGKLESLTDKWSAEDAQRPPEEVEREGRAVDDALAPKVTVLLTFAEFTLIAPLPALFAAGLIAFPDSSDDDFEALRRALSSGAFRALTREVVIGTVSPLVESALLTLKNVANMIELGIGQHDSWKLFVEQLVRSVPTFSIFGGYGGSLVRST